MEDKQDFEYKVSKYKLGYKVLKYNVEIVQHTKLGTVYQHTAITIDLDNLNLLRIRFYSKESYFTYKGNDIENDISLNNPLTVEGNSLYQVTNLLVHPGVLDAINNLESLNDY